MIICLSFYIYIDIDIGIDIDISTYRYDTDVDIHIRDKLNSCSSFYTCPKVITDIYHIALLQPILEFLYPPYSTSISASFCCSSMITQTFIPESFEAPVRL